MRALWFEFLCFQNSRLWDRGFLWKKNETWLRCVATVTARWILVIEGLSRNFKTHRTKYDYHSWKELVEISKNVKFGKDCFTNCEDVNFQKSKFYMKTFGNLRLEATLASNKGFYTKFRFLKIHIFAICEAIFSKLDIFTNFNEFFPVMIIIFFVLWVLKLHHKPSFGP